MESKLITGSVSDDPEFVGRAIAAVSSMFDGDPTGEWTRFVAYIDSLRAPRSADADMPEAIRMLGLMFDAYENGICCYEEPEDQQGYIGNAFKLDTEDFDAICELLNRRKPPRYDVQKDGSVVPVARSASVQGAAEFNVNDMFEVKLTKFGAGVWNSRYDGMNLPFNLIPAAVEEGHVLKAQLWSLMQEFGPHITLSGQVPFTNCAIRPAATSTPAVQPLAAIAEQQDQHGSIRPSAEPASQHIPTAVDAANFIDARAEKYLQVHADSENDTGVVVFHYGEAGRDYHSMLVELAEELRTLAASEASASPLAPVPASAPLAEEPLNFVQALKIANSVFERYKEDQYKWWRKMDGTPILNDVAVRMAEAFMSDDPSPPVPETPVKVGENNQGGETA